MLNAQCLVSEQPFVEPGVGGFGCVRNKGNPSAREVEIVETEAEATDAFVGVVVKAEVIGASLPAQLDV